jgi:hypothetical protein
MWNGRPRLDRLLRGLSRRSGSRQPIGNPSVPAGSGVPDLFANHEKLYQVAEVRDAVRSLRREARDV